MSSIEEKMRVDWNARARSDAHYYVATGRRHQTKAEFLEADEPVLNILKLALSRVRSIESRSRIRALEIGCGPGRLMLQMEAFVDELCGVDVSNEMLRLAHENLKRHPKGKVYQNTGSDLAMFSDCSFDFTYSYAVYQHIPSVSIISRYIEESARTLTQGGVSCFQFRGSFLPGDEVAGEDNTWAGCVFDQENVTNACLSCGMNILEFHGLQTPHLWVVARKLMHAPVSQASEVPRLLAIAPTTNPLGLISPTGPGAWIECWLEKGSSLRSLGNISVRVGGRIAFPCYLGESLDDDTIQLNVMLPEEVPLGEVSVAISNRGIPIAGVGTINVQEYPLPSLSILRVSDGVDLLAKHTCVSRTLRVRLGGVQKPEDTIFAIGLCNLKRECFCMYDPALFAYEFLLVLPVDLASGTHELVVKLHDRVCVTKITVVGDAGIDFIGS